MIYETFKKYKYAIEYNQSEVISDDVIDSMLKKTWEVTPSKNNFIPYKIHVIGPKHQSLKDLVYKKCLNNESMIDEVSDVESIRYHTVKPNFANILSCSHLFIFTQRVETQFNALQQLSISRGCCYEQTDETKLESAAVNARIEIGLFCSIFAGICFENNIDIAHTLCFSDRLSSWSEPEFKFIDKTPLLLMTVGKGLRYRQDQPNTTEMIRKPDYSRIVNFI